MTSCAAASSVSPRQSYRWLSMEMNPIPSAMCVSLKQVPFGLSGFGCAGVG